MMLLIQGTHCGRSGRNQVIDEEEERILWLQVDPFPDQKVELSDGQVRRHQVLLFVQVPDPSLRCLFHDHLHDNKQEKKVRERKEGARSRWDGSEAGLTTLRAGIVTQTRGHLYSQAHGPGTCA